jgi:hypothetical protein
MGSGSCLRAMRVLGSARSPVQHCHKVDQTRHLVVTLLDDETVRLYRVYYGTIAIWIEKQTFLRSYRLLNNGKYLKTNQMILSFSSDLVNLVRISDMLNYQNHRPYAMLVGRE